VANFEVLVNKSMFDPAFAQLLKSDPATALRNIGIEPTPERLDAIKKVDIDAIAKAATAIGTSQKTTPN
jgi:hypothetical protein